MPLQPTNEPHALQIQAGITGRREGHSFESRIANAVNELHYPLDVPSLTTQHLFRGDPARLMLQYVGAHLGLETIARATALSTGALATSEEGQQWLNINGAKISRCKSDIILTIATSDGRQVSVGVSTKQCNNRSPTNAQLYFTTARGFANLLFQNGIEVSDEAICSLRQFCGDTGFRPKDLEVNLQTRNVDPRRYFWEEIESSGRLELELLFKQHHSFVFRLLLQKAYLDDPFTPEYLLHKTKRADSWTETEVALYSVDELVLLSCRYRGFETRPYSVRKGQFRDPVGVTHLAPRFGIVQMQRGGQAQHPDQLQFNLEAGYFYKI